MCNDAPSKTTEHHDGAVPTCFLIDCKRSYLVENRTPYDIQINHHGQLLVVPGLATRRMSGKRLKYFEPVLVGPRQRHHLRVTPHHATSSWSTLFGLVALFALMALPVILVVRFVQDGTFLRSLTGVLVGAAGAAGLLALTAWLLAEQRRNQARDRYEQRDGDVAHGSSALLEPDTSMGRRLWNFGALLVMIVIGVLLPATWIYFGTELHRIVSFEDGLSVAPGDAGEATWRSIQITYVAVLVTLPAVLYFLFDRMHINGLVHQWSRDIFRLDRRVETLADMQARYGHRMAEATRQSPSSSRLVGSKRSPIILATLLFAVGWTLLILPTRARDTTSEVTSGVARAAAGRAEQAAEDATKTTDPAEQAAAATEAAQAADLAEGAADRAVEDLGDDPAAVGPNGAAPGPTDPTVGEQQATTTLDPVAEAQADAIDARAAATAAEVAVQATGSDTFDILDPKPSAATAAFLGAYFFSLFAALRGFSRRDLRPKLYVSMAARVALTASIAFLIVVVTPWGDSPPAIALAFVAGITPMPILSAIVFAPLKSVARRLGTSSTDGVQDALSNRRPLTDLDHIDLVEDARLDAEGITDVEALAHGDIVELMVATRTPAGRLVDWVDQALLVLHVQEPGNRTKAARRVDRLRKVGLRTATDLVEAAVPSRAARTEVLAIFEDESKLAAAVASITAEPNFAFVNWWKLSPLGDPSSEHKLVLSDAGCLTERFPMDRNGTCGDLTASNSAPDGGSTTVANETGHRNGDRVGVAEY